MHSHSEGFSFATSSTPTPTPTLTHPTTHMSRLSHSFLRASVSHHYTHRITGEECALKEIRLDHEEGAPCTAIREASLLRDLKHANIVTLHDIIHTPTTLTFVFEYLKMDLKQYLDQAGGYIVCAVLSLYFSFSVGVWLCVLRVCARACVCLCAWIACVCMCIHTPLLVHLCPFPPSHIPLARARLLRTCTT